MTRSSISLTPEIIDYIIAANPIENETLRLCRLETANHPRGKMQISPEQGAFMSFLLRLIDARIAVEVGVFTGYSSLATALALRANAGPGARLFALEISHAYLNIAKKYWEMAQVTDTIVPMIAPAISSINTLLESGYEGKIDFIFIDADKKKYLDYLPLAKKLLRSGGLLMFDNALLNGRVADAANTDEEVIALRELVQIIKSDPKLDECFIGIGDGLLLARKKS